MKASKLLVSGLVVGVLIFGALGVFVFTRLVPKTPGGDVSQCTLEAKQCPDGSFVGRTGPNCEFTACPEAVGAKEWGRITDPSTGISFEYPNIFEVTPKFQFVQKPYSCPESLGDFKPSDRPELRRVQDREYCMAVRQEDLVKSSYYATFMYVFPKKSGTMKLVFTMRFANCEMYEKSQKTDCENYQRALDIDALADRMAQSATMKP